MPPRTTDRSITTCRNCRRRKIRCDRGRPRCNRCRESGSTCVYEDQVPQRIRSYQFVTETPGNALREAFDAGSGEASAATVPIPIDRLQRIESHVENLTQMMQTLQARSGRASRSGVGSRGSSASRNAAQPTPSNVSDLGLSRVSTNQSNDQNIDFRYVDLSSLTTLCDEVAELGDLLSNQARFLLQSAQVSPADTPGPGETIPWPTAGPSGTQRPSIARTLSEPTNATQATSPIDPMMDMEMNPPNIDWAYLDQVLRGDEDPDDGPGPSGERRP